MTLQGNLQDVTTSYLGSLSALWRDLICSDIEAIRDRLLDLSRAERSDLLKKHLMS